MYSAFEGHSKRSGKSRDFQKSGKQHKRNVEKAKTHRKEPKVVYTETKYSEIEAGNFLYQLVTANIECFGDIDKVNKTVLFFHRYKTVMSFLKIRLEKQQRAGKDSTTMNESTHAELKEKIADAIGELESIANLGRGAVFWWALILWWRS